MARVKIVVEREDGSTIKIVEESAMPLFTDGQCALLAQEAYVRVLRALGVQQQPDPEPPPPAGAQNPTHVVAPQGDGTTASAILDEVLDSARRKAA